MRQIFFWVLLLMVNSGYTCDIHGQTGIVEENDLWIGPEVKSVNSITKEKFEELLDRVEAIYNAEIKGKGAELVIERNWDDGTVNAYAYQEGTKWHIAMFGGLARHETITYDGMILVACHELGHHLGGAPKKPDWGGAVGWASNEGEADYFGTLKCLKKVFEKDDNISIIKARNIDTFATEKCNAQFKDPQDAAICVRGSMAGMSVANLFNALRNRTIPLRFDTPDTKYIKKTFHDHPQPQCRLDTYFAGSVCNKDPYTEISDELATDVGACTLKEGAKIGTRPNCWFGTENNML